MALYTKNTLTGCKIQNSQVTLSSLYNAISGDK